jgi:hypothetical protein
MITADNEYDTVKDLVDADVVDVFSIKVISNPFGVLTKLSQGYWPAIKNGKLVMAPTPPDKFARIGAYLIEGTTTIGELCHADHINKARQIGENIVGKFSELVETDTGVEEITYGKSAMSHYQQVQDYVCFNLIPGFAKLPVKWVWWTGHEYMGEDEATGRSMLGPGVVGKAAVMRVPRVVGNTFHMVANEEVSTNPQTHKTTRTLTHRAYFEKHKDAFMAGQSWPAGLKIPMGDDGSFLKGWQAKFPDGYIELTQDQGVEAYVKYHQEIARKTTKLVLTPGTEIYVESSAKDPAPLPAQTTPLPSTGGASQLKPAPRPAVMPLRKPVPPLPRPAPLVAAKPTLEAQLIASIEQVTGKPVSPDSGPPSINDAEPGKEGA